MFRYFSFVLLNNNPFYSIIVLSFVLAVGFLLVILSCTLYYNWWPLFVAATFILALLPNAICSKCAGGNDFLSDHHSDVIDAGHFITGMFIITGFCLPAVLAHAGVITFPAMIMGCSGGTLVYGTIIAYTHFFSDQGYEF
ncbi:vacuolar protein sorting 55 [Backusella circina FSU 941]|nr:vacuolar protein sorting 55 [Backusella circina FSU 941]